MCFGDFELTLPEFLCRRLPRITVFTQARGGLWEDSSLFPLALHRNCNPDCFRVKPGSDFFLCAHPLQSLIYHEEVKSGLDGSYNFISPCVYKNSFWELTKSVLCRHFFLTSAHAELVVVTSSVRTSTVHKSDFMSKDNGERSMLNIICVCCMHHTENLSLS